MLKNKLSLSFSLRKACKFLNTSSCPIKSFYKCLRYNDEPLLYQYAAIVGKNKTEWAGGMSFDEERAKMKALGEAMERYCLSVFNKLGFVKTSTKELKSNALRLGTLASFSESQRKEKNFKSFLFNDNTSFLWTEGYSLTDRTKLFLPAQLIYVPYDYQNEPIIRLPVSTGAACGNLLDDALYRGICEVVERDSFMIFYLNKLTPPIVDLDNSGKKFRDIFRYFGRYDLGLIVFDITTDIKIPVVMAIIIDKTGIGPRISVGLKCSLSLEEAIIGSIEEAQHTRPWMRDEMARIEQEELLKIKKSPEGIATTRERGLFWYDGKLIKSLGFWLNPRRWRKAIKSHKRRNSDGKSDFKVVLELLREKGYKIYYKEITVPEILRAGFRVVKVIIPQLHPLYLEEKYEYLGGKRLYEVPRIMGFRKSFSREEELNYVPHPFL